MKNPLSYTTFFINDRYSHAHTKPGFSSTPLMSLAYHNHVHSFLRISEIKELLKRLEKFETEAPRRTWRELIVRNGWCSDSFTYPVWQSYPKAPEKIYKSVRKQKWYIEWKVEIFICLTKTASIARRRIFQQHPLTKTSLHNHEYIY